MWPSKLPGCLLYRLSPRSGHFQPGAQSTWLFFACFLPAALPDSLGSQRTAQLHGFSQMWQGDGSRLGQIGNGARQTQHTVRGAR